MSNSGNGEPSMEEILASIRALVSQDSTQEAPQPGTAPPRSAQQQLSEPAGVANPRIPVQDKPSLPAAGPAELPGPAPQAPQTSPARVEEDDLADLLDEPLPAGDKSVSSPSVAPPLSVNWSPGANDATAAAAERGPGSTGPAAAPMPFDFGAMVPSRDPAPTRDAAPMPSLSHAPAPAATPTTSPAATAAIGSLSPGWPQPGRGTQNGALAPSRHAPESSSPSQNAEATLTALAPKSPTGTADAPPSKTPDKPAADAIAPAASREPGRFFSAPVTSSPSPVLPVGGAVSRSQEPKPASQLGTGAATGKTDASSSGREASPASASFLTRGGGAGSETSGKLGAPATGYASMEPVLKAFGKIETKLDRPGPGPANGSADAAGGASKAEPSGSTSAPEAASTPAKPTAKSGNESIGHRTLEDAVMHLLRPMLREWLDDNLPRIVEDAVRREIAGAVKSKIEPVSKP